VCIEAWLFHFEFLVQLPLPPGFFLACVAAGVVGAGGAGEVVEEGGLHAPQKPGHGGR
jgi:hypothetical protein